MTSDGKAPERSGPERTMIVPHDRTIAGKYRLLRLIGEGGMGSVYEAEHLGLGMRVAIKLLAESFSEDQVFVKRFRREARAAGAVNHENVVTVTDTGTDEDGIPFLVMELLDGESLASVLRRARTLTPESAAGIAYQVLAGLGAAHEKGVVHRDLKPANVFLVPNAEGRQRVKLLDFGISKFAADVTNQVTQDGAVIGTPSYMAPEQVKGRPDVDGRADLYAVGVMLYRMVCGRLPFAAKQTRDIYERILSGNPIPPRQYREDLSPQVEAVMLQAMALRPEDRFQTAAEFQLALIEAIPSLERTNPVPLYSRAAGGSEPQPVGVLSATPSPRTERFQRSPPADEPAVATRDIRPGSGPGHTKPFEPTAPALTPQRSSIASEPARSTFLRTVAIAVVGLAAAVAALAGAVVVAKRGGFGEETDRTVTPANDDSDTTPARPLGPPLRYGVPRHTDRATILDERQPLVDYLTKRLRRQVELVIVEPQELPQRLRDGSIDLAALSAVPYVTAKNDLPRLRLLATAYLIGGPTYEGVVISRAESEFAGLRDLRGKVFCYPNELSSSGYFYTRALFRRAGIDPDRAFASVRFTQDHATAVRLLANGHCDGAAVYESIVYDRSETGHDARLFDTLATTGELPNDAYCVNADRVSEADATEIEEALLALEPGSREARRVFRDEGDIRGFIRGDDAAYDSAREVLRYLDETSREAPP